MRKILKNLDNKGISIIKTYTRCYAFEYQIDKVTKFKTFKPHLRLCIALFAVAEVWLLLDTG